MGHWTVRHGFEKLRELVEEPMPEGPFRSSGRWTRPETMDIPPEITTPDTVETRIGTLKFLDGFPDDATVQPFRLTF